MREKVLNICEKYLTAYKTGDVAGMVSALKELRAIPEEDLYLIPKHSRYLANKIRSIRI